MAPSIESLPLWMKTYLSVPLEYGLSEMNRTQDQLGMLHIRYRQTYKNVPIQGTMYIAHTRNGKIESVGGVVYNDITGIGNIPLLNEANALHRALGNVNAVQYKWQVAAEEAEIKHSGNNPLATYYPKAELFYLKSKGAYHLCYAFNIYAQRPLSRTMEYIDAMTGQTVLSKNLIEHINTNGTAVTKYSGTKPFQTDSVSATNFRLRDNSRGLGVATYDMNTGTSYGSSVDFTDADNNWNNVNPTQDEAATDAHWGAQKTYDYLFTKYGRNSIDNAGFLLRSYVHYDIDYVNAFWDGSRMTYGDGDFSSGFDVMTGLDVCGHEIGHGLVNYTSDLSGSSSGSDECDALNEGFADIIGTSVEKFARPTQWDWIIGGDISCSTSGIPNGLGLRKMSNPAAYGQPNCYQGTNWSASGEPHDNDGPLIYWFYLLSTGSAANNITALGNDTSENIAYRTLTVHLFPSADYADARFYSIISSTELYGGCSVPTIATTNAWAAVCVGNQYVASSTVSNFTGDLLQTCNTTLTVNFTNTSTNGNTFTWYFGDGGTSTLYNPSHTYATGVYNVKLVVNGGPCGNDSLTQTAMILVGPPPGPSTIGATLCNPGTAILNATPSTIGDTIRWYSNASGGTSLYTGNNFTTPFLGATTTYYAEEAVQAPVYHVGPLNNSIGGGGNYTNTTRFTVFNCTAPTTLKSVWVFAQGAGNRTIILKNSSGTILQSATVNIPNGGSVVTLNMPLPIGTGLQLGLSTTSASNLYRNSTGAVYPYTNGPISITGNTAAGSASYYYFFYDWVLQAGECYSVRTPTTVIVNTGLGITPATITAPGGLSTCAPGTVTLNANTGTGLSYQWHQGLTAISGATNASYNASVTGSYSVVVSSAGGCMTPGTSSSVSVLINSLPSANIIPAGPVSFCQGGSVLLNGTSGTGNIYQWYKNGTLISGATNLSYTASQTGNYTVQSTNSSNCMATSSAIAVTSNTPPLATVSPSGTAAFCLGDSIALMANSGIGYSYQWYMNGTMISGANLPGYFANQAGNFSVMVTNMSNCSTTSSTTNVSVSSIPTPITSATGPTTFCAGGSVVLQVSSGIGLTYQWYLNSTTITGATSDNYSATQTGNYTVVVSNASLCNATSTQIAVTVTALPTATISPSGSTTFCIGGSVALHATTGTGFLYQWSLNGTSITGATSSSYIATLAGSYTVEITNTSNCSANSSATIVTVTTLPTPTIINTAGVLTVSGGPYTSYQWYLNGSPISGAFNAAYTVTANGIYSVEVGKDGCFGKSMEMNLTGVDVHDIVEGNIVISPNPATDLIHIEGIKAARMIIRNMQGQTVKEASDTNEISVADLATGMYFLQLYDSNGILLLKYKIIKN